jgi:hypothetical protein
MTGPRGRRKQLLIRMSLIQRRRRSVLGKGRYVTFCEEEGNIEGQELIEGVGKGKPVRCLAGES